MKSVAELNKLYESAKAKQESFKRMTQVKVHLGSCGIASGADKVLETFNRELDVLKCTKPAVKKPNKLNKSSLRKPLVSAFAASSRRSPCWCPDRKRSYISASTKQSKANY